MFTWKRFILATCATLFLALVFIVMILPGMIIDHAGGWISENTGRNLTIESVSINPFTLSIEVRKLQLSNASQTGSFMSWDLFRASFSIASLYHRAPIIDELRLDNPSLFLQRLKDGSDNFTDLLPRQEDAASEKTTGGPARFSVNNLAINDGQIDLVDSSLDVEVHHKIKDLQLALPSLGNLPYMIENPAQPLFRAVINDSPIDLESKLKLFTNVREMQFNLNLESIDLPFYLGYVPIKLPVEVRNGKLSLDLDIIYRITAESHAELELKGRADLASLDIWDHQQEELFFLPLLQVEIAASQPLEQEVHLSAIRAYNLEVQLKRDRTGKWNHARMAAAKGEQESPQGQETNAAPLRLLVDTIEIRDGEIFFVDNFPVNPFKTTARGINIDVKDFALDAQSGMPLSISFRTDRDESASLHGQFLLDPFSLTLQADLKNIDVEAYEPYYHGIYSVPLGGKLGLQSKLSSTPKQPLLVSDGRITWQDAYMAFNEEEGMGVAQVDIAGVSFNLNENRLVVDSAHYKDGKVNFSRNSAGHWSFFSLNFPILAKLSEAPSQEPVTAVTAEGPLFSYRIGEFNIENWAFQINDKLPRTPVNLEANDFNLTLHNLAAPDEVESPFTFSMTFQRKGQVEIKGTASLASQTVQMKTLLKKISLSTFAPYIAEQLNLDLADGYLNARLQSTISAGSKPAQVTYKGDVGVSRLHLLDALHREDLLKWDSLQVAGIEGKVKPLTLKIESLALSDYYAKVLIDKDARLNLTEAFRKPQAGDADTLQADEFETKSQGAEPKESDAEESKPAEIGIETIIMQGGHVDFTDLNLLRPFHADMRSLGGRIHGLSSNPETRATIDLRGHLRNQSPLVISGVANPLAEKLSLDLKLSFNDIELSPLSSYSGTYVGYLIEKGKLNLALEYYVEDDQLKAINKVFLDQFSFGEAVESEKAIGLPVNLAVALLKNKDGEIHLDIPVSGHLDDPQFSITGVVWKVLKNLLIKAATSPLALLGTLVGDGNEDFSNVSFEYGSARLNSSEKEKLKKMSQALRDRPSLEVEISGFIDPVNDIEGYRREQLTLQIKRQKYLDLIETEELPEETTEEEVIVPAEEYADYLWQVYSNADFPKPRNFIGLTKKIPVSEMEKLIYTNTPVSQGDLAALAQARALAVQNFMIKEGQLAQARIFLKEPDITKEPSHETVNRARVELGATVH